jgi:hypothetical protein
VWIFLLAVCAGNIIKATVVAFAGSGAATLLGPTLQKWLGH